MSVQRNPPTKKALPGFVNVSRSAGGFNEETSFDYHCPAKLMSKRELVDFAAKEQEEEIDWFCNEWTKQLRGTPAYWQVMKRDILSAVREEGAPAISMSCSSNDLHWESHVS